LGEGLRFWVWDLDAWVKGLGFRFEILVLG